MADVTKNPGAFRLHKRELIVVVMTTLILAAIVALMIGHFLRQDLAELLATMKSPVVIAKATPPAEPTDHEKKKPAATNNPAPAHVTQASEPSFHVVVSPASSIDEPVSSQIPTEAEAQEPPASSNPATPRPTVEPASARPEIIGRTTGIVAGVFAVAVVAPLVFAYCFFALLRRHGERFGALIQIHNAIAQPVRMDPALAAGPALPPAHFVAPPESISPPAAVEDEMPKPSGDAVFEQLFAETLELQSQLDRARKRPT
jgi:hypothetical protein